ncbi:MAG: alkaline phosphatase family protein, partial [Anaerolineae bacterium]|nr:alkaline phosphatase family protein [Anaerolineae bacterium]
MSVNKTFPMAAAVLAAYDAGEEDEALEPITRVDGSGQPMGRIQDGDYVIFYDIRGEREIELTSAFVSPDFPHFPRENMKVNFATMIEYAKDLPVKVAFPPLGTVQNTLSDVVSQQNLKQVKITESEKAIHVSYFLNGKQEGTLPGEDRLIIPSPEVVNYAKVPEMHAEKVADAVVKAIKNPEYQLIVVNFVNVDVVGHIEDKQAVIQAVQAVDGSVGRVVAAAQKYGVTPIVTADHGTVEKWLYPDGTVDTGHSDSPIPFILADPQLSDVALQTGDALTDVAPTILRLMNLPIPAEMTGHCLVPDHVVGESRRVLLVIADGWGIREDSYGNMIKA